MSWNPLDAKARNARYLKLLEESRLQREAEEKRKAILAANPKPPLAPLVAESVVPPGGIGFGTRRNVGSLMGKGRKRKVRKTRRNRKQRKSSS